MKADAIKALTDLAHRPESITVPGRADFLLIPQADGTYTRMDYEQQEKAAKLPALLAVHTLQGLVAYIEQDLDRRATGEKWERHVVHVVDECTVNLIGAALPPHMAREALVQAKFEALIGNTKFEFGKFLSLETCVVGLLALFEDTDDRAEVLAKLGNINAKDVTTVVDDGVSQEVLVQMGVTMLERATLKGDVKLRPYRTFREVEQPTSSFRIRLRPGQGDNALPTVALFETDGGRWKLDAIEAIASWLVGELAGRINIIA